MSRQTYEIPELPEFISMFGTPAREALQTRPESAFNRQLLELPGLKEDAASAWDLFEHALALEAPPSRLLRLLMLVRDEKAEWQARALPMLLDAGRADAAAALLPHCSAAHIAAAECAGWLAEQGIVPEEVAARHGDVAESLLDDLEKAARAGNAVRLRALFRLVGPSYRGLGRVGAVRPGVAARRLMQAARQSGSLEAEETVFLHTDMLAGEWAFLRGGKLPGTVALPPAPPPPPRLLRPLAEADKVGEMMERVRVMDKDVVTRVEKVVERAFGKHGFERELGACVDPAAFVPLKARFPLFAGLIDELQARASLLWRVAARTGQAQAMRFPNVLIVGQPGWGKTYFIEQLAQVLDLPFRALQMSAMSAGFILCGSDPVWSTSRPGVVHDLLAYGDKLNPLLLLDEIDKVAGDSKYPADGPLYQLLEPQQASAFQDEFAGYPIDASHINWFASANDVERIPAPILSRFDVFELPEPTPEIARDTARSVYRESLARSPWAVLFPGEADDAVIERLAAVSPREGSRQLAKAFGRASLAGREYVSADDFEAAPASRRRIGFVH